MPRGGARPGAGRKKGYKEAPTLEKEEARKRLREMVVAKLTPLVEAQIKHAQGISYLVVRGKKGGRFEKVTKEMIEGGILASEDHIVEAWEKEPSVQAFVDLMNRALDRPAEQVQQLDVTLSGGGLLERLLAGRKRVAEAKEGKARI